MGANAERLSQQMMSRSRSKKTIVSGFPFELTLRSVSDIDKYNRAQDKERVAQFNDDVKAWAVHVTSKLQMSVRTMVHRNVDLAESIHPNIYYDTKYTKEASRIGFSFNREGIYIHRGAGRGYGGFKGGSKWTDRFGRLKKTNPESFFKMGSGNRRAIQWFNPVIERELPYLADIVSEYSADLQLDATNIFIND